jgi:RNA polymerase sigma factor (sigma-70 family)
MIPELRDLWKRILAGDPSAWRKLVESYSPLVFTVARRTGLNESDAEDCTQEVWLTLYRTKRSIKDPQAIPAWLIKATHRRAIAQTNRSRRTYLKQDHEQIISPSLPDDELLQIEREFLVREALKRLDPRCRLLIESLYFNKEQISYKELSKAIGISPNGLGPLRTRCFNKLAKVLKKMGLSED